MITNEIHYFQEVLRRMQEADPELRVCGSTRHKYRLGPPLAEKELLAFEQQYQVRLPADYRFFLREVGNGGVLRSSVPIIAINAGAGPGYGLLPLEEAVAGCDLGNPFPLVPSSPGQPVQGKDNWGDEEPWPGVLEISHSGCAFFSYLVVNGPTYGTVWDADIDQMNFYPTGLSFEEWYRGWLDKLINRALPMLEHEHVVEQVILGMTMTQVIGICGGRWQQRDFGEGHSFLYFELLATQFELDETDRVVKIVRHDVPLGR